MEALNPLQTARPKIQSIEAARGVAATMVVCFHSASHLSKNGFPLPAMGGLEVFGHAGVDFFFVISGFIILFVHKGHLGRPSALWHYLERRTTRIFPLYWAVLFAGVTVGLVGSKHGFPDFLFVLRNAFLLPAADDLIIGVAWTLQHELLFYLVFAVAILNQRFGSILFAIWMVLVALRICGFLESQGPAFIVATSSFNIQFALGMMAALAVQKRKVQAPWVLVTAGIAAFVFAGLAESFDWIDGHGDLARVLYGVPALALLVGLVEVERMGMKVPVSFQVLGRASYSIYLVHEFGLGFSYKAIASAGLLDLLPLWLLSGVLVLSGVTLGIFVSYAIEYPLIRLSRRALLSR